MKQKRARDVAEAVSALCDGASIMIGGFGRAGVPERLIDGVCGLGVRDLTVINNNSGFGETGVAALIRSGCIRKLICSFPWWEDAYIFREAYQAGRIELEIVPQGTLAERIRAGGAGIGGFLTPVGIDTELAEGKRVMDIAGRSYLLELPLRADLALIRADKVDPLGNLTYRKAARNFNPVMATAADLVIVEAREEVGLGDLDPEAIVTPGVYVDRYFVAAS